MLWLLDKLFLTLTCVAPDVNHVFHTGLPHLNVYNYYATYQHVCPRYKYLATNCPS